MKTYLIDSDILIDFFKRKSEAVMLVEKLGKPIRMGMWVGGSINVTPADGRAELVMPISGPKGKGMLAVSAVKTAGEWHYKVMTVTVEGGGRVNLLNQAEQKLPDQLEVPPDSSLPEPSSN